MKTILLYARGTSIELEERYFALMPRSLQGLFSSWLDLLVIAGRDQLLFSFLRPGLDFLCSGLHSKAHLWQPLSFIVRFFLGI